MNRIAFQVSEMGRMQTGDFDDHRGWIQAVCREFGLSVTELARTAGLAPSTLTRFLKDDSPTMLAGRTLHKLRNAEQKFRLSNGGADHGPAVPAFRSGKVVREDQAMFNVPHAPPMRLLALELAPSDASGPPGGEELELVQRIADPRDGQEWPAFDEYAVRLFAIYMPGEFMRPRFRTGEYLLIDRSRPASINSEVLVEFAARPGEASIGTIAGLIDRDRNQVKLSQLQHATTATIHRSEIRNIFPVVGVFQGDLPETNLRLDLRTSR